MSRSEKDRAKQIQDKCQQLLNQMLRDEDNKYCVDCDAKGPRWASWNIGIFLCIRCAGIHRNLGVHISKVKSVNLDTWTPEQVVSLQQMGNSRARAVYEANLPDSFRRPQTDSSLETFIRAKYEAKKYIAGEWVQPPLPKINWDKELDEEAERNRKKKKEAKNLGGVAIPVPKKLDSVVPQAIPKPNSSPKSSSRGTPPRSTSVPKPASADLLGLDTPTSEGAASQGDDFSSFLSAPSAASTASTAPKRSEEEDSFFNQALPETTTPGRLTTDSILALYAKSPQQPQYQFQQPFQPFPQTQFPHNGVLPKVQQVPNTQITSNPFYQMSNTQQNITKDFSAMKINQINQPTNLANTNLWQ
ncbi:stromal membrane-associated protein 1-like [Cimex lectularius]|uniref:Arf-GAP domain-containing protein n=1 Tax=Cimex lectularius TaxID=79782 RepID=A0A8I6RFK7_CIMLE|nr:stromal membrane-associated protein 1-like [Cimex lectularius]XP_014241473.1 stromal membrane-associated protein 1-like [Cimex lectularius]